MNDNLLKLINEKEIINLVMVHGYEQPMISYLPGEDIINIVIKMFEPTPANAANQQRSLLDLTVKINKSFDEKLFYQLWDFFDLIKLRDGTFTFPGCGAPESYHCCLSFRLHEL